MSGEIDRFRVLGHEIHIVVIGVGEAEIETVNFGCDGGGGGGDDCVPGYHVDRVAGLEVPVDLGRDY
ncbi:hypothetical protein TRV_06568 [Trichophyton verrucosum HKI 0517]|uniref:Uncharacterized protein n=1 Tax=Trichophyton verrucosum (strain HKI 0517) TaxID=663202 RepID=D4DHB2_TRIVH|nr:uncharacterized protein TRV_06568 [Trichophyton verrucosum HKI 0517]EFE38756.1 hypothetical protein TRV_06568 [Trichophyton verrucosum HKI 0517]